MLLAKPAEELEARWRSIPGPIKARKLQDLVANGVQSDYVPAALGKLARMCAEMDAALSGGPWLMGAEYSLADALVTPYFYRIDCLGLSGLWETRYPPPPTGSGVYSYARRWVKPRHRGLMKLKSAASGLLVPRCFWQMTSLRIISRPCRKVCQ